MRNFAVMVLSLIGVISLLDVAASFAINGSVTVPLVLVLVVAAAGVAQVVGRRRRPQRVTDPRDVITLVRLRLQAAALERHTRVLTDHRQVVNRASQHSPGFNF
jgi:hypothetical protein